MYVEYHAALGLSDHVIITCNQQVRLRNQKKVEPHHFRYHKGNYKKMNQNLLEMDWETDLNALTVEDAWKFFSLMLNIHIKISSQ